MIRRALPRASGSSSHIVQGSVHDGGVISRSAAGGFCGGDFATVSAPDRVVTGLSDKVELIDFNLAEKENPMTDARLPPAELAAKSGDPDFLRAIAESVLQLIMEADVDGLIGAGRYERGEARQTWRNG